MGPQMLSYTVETPVCS